MTSKIISQLKVKVLRYKLSFIDWVLILKDSISIHYHREFAHSRCNGLSNVHPNFLMSRELPTLLSVMETIDKSITIDDYAKDGGPDDFYEVFEANL